MPGWTAPMIGGGEGGGEGGDDGGIDEGECAFEYCWYEEEVFECHDSMSVDEIQLRLLTGDVTGLVDAPDVPSLEELTAYAADVGLDFDEVEAFFFDEVADEWISSLPIEIRASSPDCEELRWLAEDLLE